MYIDGFIANKTKNSALAVPSFCDSLTKTVK